MDKQTPLNQDGLRAAAVAIVDYIAEKCERYVIEDDGDTVDFGRFKPMVMAEAAIRAYLEHDDGWLPIDSLEMEYCHGYAVSKTIMVAIHFPETKQYQIKISRVWEENAERSLPDIPYGEYSRVTHFRYLPTPPRG